MSRPEETLWGSTPDLTIPEIRQRLHVIGDRLDGSGHTDVGAELHGLAEATRRLGPSRKAPRAQGTPDAEQAAEIRDYAQTHPDETMFDIGRRFNVNQGRVSEAISGKRGQ